MTMEVSKVLDLPGKCNSYSENLVKVLRLSDKNAFWHFCRHVRMSGSARPATQNDFRTRFETVWASNLGFRARLPQNFTLCSYKIDVFLGVFPWASKFATSKSMSRAWLPSILITCHKMPCLPHHWHVVTTWCSPDNAIRKSTQHDMSNVLRVARKMTMEVTKVLCLPRKSMSSSENDAKCIAPVTQSDFGHVIKHVGNVTKFHACHAKRSYATFQSSRRDHF